ncbi:Rne/Rng family ribonuclease [Leifsonia sp. H3M29-4]|uniref:Rne/Rng family ribonuclease n=1 Tax=Salinibacterium metalliresistens TaxID=3031321 RepID=UPI0023DCC896|nr:Rne/Rng family ribonuclease [Salinibacterium metalliresistens]MDF1478751.1 Rne/Rng family ribonuclease [Salinibacterium metalliresistens]
MVNTNEEETPKKRSRLFGGRRASADAAAPEPQTPPAAPAEAAQAAAPEVQQVEAPRAEAAEPRKRAPRSAPAKSAAEHVASTTEPSESSSPGTESAEEAAPKSRPRTRKKPITEPAPEMNTEAPDIETPSEPVAPVRRPTTSLLFQAPDLPPLPERSGPLELPEEPGSVRRRSRRRPGEDARPGDDAPNTVVRVREPRRQQQPELITEPQRVKGSTRLEAKKQRRRDGRDAGRRRPVVTESEFLARREAVDRVMVVRSKFGRIQIAVLEDGVLVEHYVARSQEASLIGNVYLGRVQNVLPSMEAAFVDIGRGRNAVLYSGEVDWDAAAENSAEGKNQARRIELALKPGDRVLVQVTKDPVGHKGARLTSQVSLPGRYLVYVPNGSMSGISRKLPDTERARLKKILKEVLPENVGVIVRTAAEGATEEQLTLDVQRLTNQWAEISRQVETVQAPALLHSEPDLLIKIIRDVFNEDFHRLVIEGDDARQTIESYLRAVAPDLIDRVASYEGSADSFDEFRVSEQIEKALDRKVWLPSGGSLVIDRTEAMTVVDVNTGKFVGSGGNLEETVTKNNLEAAEEIVRQLRLRDIGGIIVVDFIDMVLETNRDLVLRRLVECLSRDRTKHQVAEVTSLGLVQMTRKKLGLGLLETFSEPCETCAGRGIIVHHDPVTKHRQQVQTAQPEQGGGRRNRNRGGGGGGAQTPAVKNGVGSAGTHAITEDVRNALARVAASTVHTESIAIVDAAASAPVESAVPVVEETVAILDIPVAKAARQPRRALPKDAEQILGSVLDALPEPKQPGQGRSRVSRRAGSAGAIVSAPVTTEPSEPQD